MKQMEKSFDHRKSDQRRSDASLTEHISREVTAKPDKDSETSSGLLSEQSLSFLDMSCEDAPSSIQDQAEIDITPLPLYIQQQLRILMKPRKQRAELDNLSLVPLLQQVKFFKERNITTDVLQKIARLAQHEFVRA